MNDSNLVHELGRGRHVMEHSVKTAEVLLLLLLLNKRMIIVT